MFFPEHWALAFFRVLEKEGNEAVEEGIETLEILASWVSSLPGEVFGRSAARKLEKLIRDAMAHISPVTPPRETAVRLIVFMVRKNVIQHIDPVITEIKKLLDKKRGLLSVTVECAMPLEHELEERIKQVLLKQTGAAGLEITKTVNPELIGGYRLRVGDKTIDASIQGRLRKMKTCLSEEGGNLWQISQT